MAGSRKNVPNKVTTDARKAIATFVDGNAHQLSKWLRSVSEGVLSSDGSKYVVAPNPAKAFELFQSVVEYHVPKLARTEVVGDGGGPLRIVASKLDEDI